MKDRFFIIGLVVGIGGILLGNALEGGHFSSLLQLTAFIIVLSGTFGAVLVTHPLSEVKASLALLKRSVNKTSEVQRQKISSEIVSAAEIAKKESPLQLEKKLKIGKFNSRNANLSRVSSEPIFCPDHNHKCKKSFYHVIRRYS